MLQPVKSNGVWKYKWKHCAIHLTFKHQAAYNTSCCNQFASILNSEREPNRAAYMRSSLKHCLIYHFHLFLQKLIIFLESSNDRAPSYRFLPIWMYWCPNIWVLLMELIFDRREKYCEQAKAITNEQYRQYVPWTDAEQEYYCTCDTKYPIG